MKEIKPLYRKEKKVGLSTHYYVTKGGDFRHERHSKKFKAFEGNKSPMKKKQLGYDYTPLYKFLLSKVGQPFDIVFSEAKKRLDKTEPIYYMV